MKNFIKIALTVITASLTFLYSISESTKTSNELIYTESYSDNLLIFRKNIDNRIIEYVMIQGTDDSPIGVSEFSVSNNGREATVIMGDNTWIYSLDNSISSPIKGIAHFRSNDPAGVSRNDILHDVSELSINIGGKKNCDDKCLSGGCGASSCSRTVTQLECSVTCNSGYMACCADLISSGCHCKKDDCCNVVPSGPIIKPGE